MMKKALILSIPVFILQVALGGKGQTAQEGQSIPKNLPGNRAVISTPIPSIPQSPVLTPADTQVPSPPFYNPIGKPDPFLPTTVSVDTKNKGKKVLPLEQFEVNDFELVGVVTGSGINKAMVQDLTGKGFFIQVGTRIGKMGGKVIRITQKEVFISEPFQDFLGRKSSRVISLKLPQTR